MNEEDNLEGSNRSKHRKTKSQTSNQYAAVTSFNNLYCADDTEIVIEER